MVNEAVVFIDHPHTHCAWKKRTFNRTVTVVATVTTLNNIK